VGTSITAHIQTGPGAQPGYQTTLMDRKKPGRGFDQPPLPSAEVEERVELYLYTPSWPSWPVLEWNLRTFSSY